MRKVVLVLLAAIAFSSDALAQTTAWADKLFGGNTIHDFGVVPRGSQHKYTFKMFNIYKVPLEISDVRVSCGCVKADLSTKVLQPNEMGQVNISMDARMFSGPKTVRVFVTVGPKYISTATLTIVANARGDVVFSPTEVDFGNVQHGTKSSKFIDVEYTGSLADWRVTEIVKNGSAPFELRVEELPRLPQGFPRRGYRIHATMKPDVGSGSFKQDVVLKTSDLTGPTLTFQIVGNVQAGLAVSPSFIAVNGLKVGESQTKKIFIRASSPFRVVSVEGQGDGVTVDVPNRQDMTQVLTINIQPTKAGDIRRQLMIRTDLDGETTSLMVEGMIEP